MIEIPELVRNKALAAGADAWLEGLPALVAVLEQEWGIDVGPPYPDGTEAYVAPAVLDGGTEAVLKLCIPRSLDAARREIVTLRLADGAGCAALLRHDLDRGALLLERLGPSMADLDLPLEERTSALLDAARRMWRPAPDVDLPTGAEKARDLAAYVTRTWEELGRPCHEATVEHALACAASREAGFVPERAVLVHGDVHQWNALRAGDGWKLVDPDGLRAEPELDLGILLREDPDTPAALRARCRWLADRTGLDPTAIWEWGVVERVSTGLVCTEIGLQPVGRDMLRAADQVARER
ncbi:phosphotransferase [Iamia sp. SCSIO 61187]|uniref:aminoglycoside phosphotransferase family protein n=1 Tax=Iamia sp. SCSIO 61187 TaxID=2722752 RepID=UPI001C62F769|nr:aminoglycoside phosphotransferase family protein [Iamia sp. SCSIO 61187]QYG91486.1 phosphotransferase [Iamia sp. SCSIO 61187]